MIPRIALAWLAVLLAVPPAVGRDQPEQDEPKKDDTPRTAKAQFDALVKAFTAERQKVVAEYNQAKGEAQKTALGKYTGLFEEYAAKFLKLAEDHPNDPAATDALFWVLQNGGPAGKKVADRVVARIPDLKLEDLKRNLPPYGATAALLAAVARRVEKADADPLLPDVLGWVATTSVNPPTEETAGITRAATARLVEKFPDHPAVGRVCQSLAQGRDPTAVEQLKAIAARATGPTVKSEAVFAIGQKLADQLNHHADSPADLEKAAAAAEKAMGEAVELFEKAGLKPRRDAARAALTAFRDNPVRVGKTAPEIDGKDLDGTGFKLSDYRGKVVLLDFWGDW